MDSVDFQRLYSETYARLGFKLKHHDGISESVLLKTENKLGAKLPTALREYYLVAGREKFLNHAFNRLLQPDDLEIQHKKLTFMEENQCVLVWGANLSTPVAPNPRVFQGPIVDGEVEKWFPECNQCSSFLVFMLHLQAGYGGGMPLAASAPTTIKVRSKLDADWHFGGEVNGMRTYSRSDQAVCLLKCPTLAKKTEGWQAFAGAANLEALEAIKRDLAVNWDYQINQSRSCR
jgi:hypothetical protein